MSDTIQIFIGLLAIGLLLIGVEIYIPGGVVGIVGALCLAGAAGVALKFPAPWSMVAICGILVGSGAGLYLWIKVFPLTRAGRRLTLNKDGRQFTSRDETLDALVGREGVAQSPLRPSGLVRVDGRRVDAQSQEGWAEAGTRVHVIAVQGTRVLVRSLPPAAATTPDTPS